MMARSSSPYCLYFIADSLWSCCSQFYIHQLFLLVLLTIYVTVYMQHVFCIIFAFTNFAVCSAIFAAVISHVYETGLEDGQLDKSFMSLKLITDTDLRIGNFESSELNIFFLSSLLSSRFFRSSYITYNKCLHGEFDDLEYFVFIMNVSVFVSQLHRLRLTNQFLFLYCSILSNNGTHVFIYRLL